VRPEARWRKRWTRIWGCQCCKWTGSARFHRQGGPSLQSQACPLGMPSAQAAPAFKQILSRICYLITDSLTQRAGWKRRTLPLTAPRSSLTAGRPLKSSRREIVISFQKLHPEIILVDICDAIYIDDWHEYNAASPYIDTWHRLSTLTGHCRLVAVGEARYAEGP